MKLATLRLTVLLIPCLLGSCGTLPQPFLGKPGREGSVLSIPPPPVLIIPSPHLALLTNQDSTHYADDIAADLVKKGVPAVAGKATPADWQLRIGEIIDGSFVIPEFSVIGPDHRTYGGVRGSPVPYAAWVNAKTDTVRANADESSKPLEELLRSINAKVQEANPASLENRPAHVMLEGVKGAPGDGDHSLALDFRRSLRLLGIVIVGTQIQADFIVTGNVRISPQGRSKELVELDWVVRNRTHQFIGKVTQLHLLKPTDIDSYWGDIAAAAAKQAAFGVRQVVENATLKAHLHSRTKCCEIAPVLVK